MNPHTAHSDKLLPALLTYSQKARSNPTKTKQDSQPCKVDFLENEFSKQLGGCARPKVTGVKLKPPEIKTTQDIIKMPLFKSVQ